MRFFFTPVALVEKVIPAILSDRTEWGNNSLLGLKDRNDVSKGRKRIVIEFSSPNIAFSPTSTGALVGMLCA
jgi:arginyl-tRNA synthetase